jgi:hypothetical protein
MNGDRAEWAGAAFKRQSRKQGVVMLLKNKHRAVYSRAVYRDVIAIIDHDGGKSVTNDARGDHDAA